MTRFVPVVAVSALLVLAGCGGDDRSGQWDPKPGQEFTEVKQIRPDKDGTVSVELTANKQHFIKVADSDLSTRPFGNVLQGPTIHVRPGGTIKVRFRNKLGLDKDGKGIPTNIHYHGMHVSPLRTSDNVFRTFDNGHSYKSTVEVPEDQPTGTYWYHVHLHEISDEQVMGGLSGLLMVDGIKDQLPGGFDKVPERQIALRDVQTNDRVMLGENDIDSSAASTRLVNTLYQPKFDMRQDAYELWHMGNIGSDVFYKVTLQEHEFAIIAEDGVPVWKVIKTDHLILPPGKRFDVLVKAGEPRDKPYLLQSQPYAQTQFAAKKGGKIEDQPIPKEVETLASVTVRPGSLLPVPELPESLLSSEEKEKLDLSNEKNVEVVKKPFVFSYGDSKPLPGLINGVQFTHDMLPAIAPVLGRTQEWTLRNTTDDDHPFHIHVNSFQVMSVNGEPYKARGLQDVVTIPRQTRSEDGTKVLHAGEVVIRNKFTDFTGWFVYHCHILAHEDIGMMATIQVRKNAGVRPSRPPDTSTDHDTIHGPAA